MGTINVRTIVDGPHVYIHADDLERLIRSAADSAKNKGAEKAARLIADKIDELRRDALEEA